MMKGAIRNPMHLETPLKVTISFTHSCNLDCRHCYADCTATPSEDELSLDEWIAFLDELFDNDVIALLFEGGEPFNRPDFLKVVRHCGRRFMTRIRTNGTLVTPELARELRWVGVGTVLVDVMGACARTHDLLTGTPGSFERALAGVRALLEAGVPTQMLLILNRQNVAELQDWVDLAHALGVPRVGVLRLYPIGRVKGHWSEMALSLDEMMRALEALRVPAGLTLMQSWHPNDGNCCWQMAAVDARGNSIGCTYLRELVHYGNIRETPFLDTWDHPLYRELRAGRVTDSCRSCSESQGSCGGCRSTAFAFHGRWDAPDPFDVTLNDGVDLRALPDWMLQAKPRPPDTTGA
jgi:radical SAM protein with 4Fe4S-binding SPASM domain